MPPARKRLLVLGAASSNERSIQAFSLINGLDVIVFDRNAKSSGGNYATHVHPIDIRDLSTVLRAAREIAPDGVYPMNDHGMTAAALVSQQLGLRGISLASARAALDKGYMREVWADAGLLQPRFSVITSPEEIRQFAVEIGFPLVLKPTNCGGGGRGVYVIRGEHEIGTAFECSSRYLQWCNRMIVEQCIDGIETSMEAVRVRGRVHILAYSDKLKPDLPSRVATRIAYPGRFDASTVKQFVGTCDLAMQALGIDEGIAHVECIVDQEGRVWAIELGARAGGGHTFHPITSHVSGLNYPEWMVRFCLGETPEIGPISRKGAAYWFFNPLKSGVLEEVRGVPAARAVPGISEVSIWKQPGEMVGLLRDSLERAGCIVALGATRKEAEEAATRAGDLVTFKVRES